MHRLLIWNFPFIIYRNGMCVIGTMWTIMDIFKVWNFWYNTHIFVFLPCDEKNWQSLRVWMCTLEAWARCSRVDSVWALIPWGLALGILITGRGLSSTALSLIALMWTRKERYFPPAMPEEQGQSLINPQLHGWPQTAQLSGSETLHIRQTWLFLPLTSLGLVRLSMPAWPERSSPLASHTGPQRMSSLWSSRNGHRMEPTTNT